MRLPILPGVASSRLLYCASFCISHGCGPDHLNGVSWSYPNYPAAMPSWYNLFLLPLARRHCCAIWRSRTRRWLFVAGVFGGISLLIKIIGADHIAGVRLFLAFVEQGEYDSDESQNRAISYQCSARARCCCLWQRSYLSSVEIGHRRTVRVYPTANGASWGDPIFRF